ncbi:MAG: DUF86 domain-containing protein [Candidatus Dormibacteraeota bacterium]|uniref:DUF86 domain-containing protein n=1 Tax=Candidatus Dormiibacter inghamiae TaxID=3127013 RepID=A0A934K804_9BACT|nr:DUF86 domain-containing protein [Candidatus Dormibacteraeota bacterium]MBJ7607757.1 DUF86 domain-containing protein [Candidatus Dormibacteraeota bacterium]
MERYRGGGWRGSVIREMAEDAILRRLETLSDAAGQFSSDLRARHPEIAWRRISAFRNVRAHGYMRIDAQRIDEVVDQELPPLRAVADQELEG